MRQQDRATYLGMIPRVFIRAVRDPEMGGEEYELSEGEATSLLIERERAAAVELAEAVQPVLSILEAMRYTTGLGKNQLERIAKAKAAIANVLPAGSRNRADDGASK